MKINQQIKRLEKISVEDVQQYNLSLGILYRFINQYLQDNPINREVAKTRHRAPQKQI